MWKIVISFVVCSFMLACSDEEPWIQGDMLLGNISYSCSPIDDVILQAYMSDSIEACNIQYVKTPDGYRVNLEYVDMQAFAPYLQLEGYQYSQSENIQRNNLTFCNVSEGCSIKGYGELVIREVSEETISGLYRFAESNQNRTGTFTLLLCPEQVQALSCG
jgi:hypothetical protein